MITRKQIEEARSYNRSRLDLPEDLDIVAVMASVYQEARGLTADGQVGPKTRAQVKADLTPPAPAAPLPGVAPAPSNVIVGPWTPFDGPLEQRPRSRAEVIAMFGDPGRGKEEPIQAWVDKNIVELHGKDAIPEIPAHLYFKCHRLVEPYMREAFRRAHLACPDYPITAKTASWVFRHQRHDKDLPLSLHSWGIAVDVSYDLNGSEYFDIDEDGPEPWTPGWMKLWPKGMPQAFVEAFESVGFRWGGRWRAAPGKKGYRDPMHFELMGAGAFAL